MHCTGQEGRAAGALGARRGEELRPGRWSSGSMRGQAQLHSSLAQELALLLLPLLNGKPRPLISGGSHWLGLTLPPPPSPAPQHAPPRRRGLPPCAPSPAAALGRLGTVVCAPAGARSRGPLPPAGANPEPDAVRARAAGRRSGETPEPGSCAPSFAGRKQGRQTVISGQDLP